MNTQELEQSAFKCAVEMEMPFNMHTIAKAKVIAGYLSKALAPVEKQRDTLAQMLGGGSFTDEQLREVGLNVGFNVDLKHEVFRLRHERDELKKMVSEFNQQHEAIIDGIRQAKDGQHQAILLAAEKQSRITALEASAAKVREGAIKAVANLVADEYLKRSSETTGFASVAPSALELNEAIYSLIATPAGNATEGGCGYHYVDGYHAECGYSRADEYHNWPHCPGCGKPISALAEVRGLK